MEDEWENVTSSRTNTSLTHDFILKPVEGGKGTIQLEMTVPSGTIVEVSGDDWDALSPKTSAAVDGTKATITGSDIPAGTYNITINFYKTSGTNKFLLYSIPQTINVFAEMETNTWQDDGSSNSPISGGKFVLTDEIIKNYQRTIFYVSEKDFTGKAIENGQTRTGSPYAPFASLSDALNTITNNNKAEDYRIFIGGSVSGNTQISTLIKAENAKSLIIEGFTGNSSDCLVGDGSSSVLTVGSSVPLTIKNLRITGGNAEKGGGINMTAGSNVTLDAGALIGEDKTSLPDSSSYGNKATKGGGGIYNTQGALVLKKGSKVCYNYEGSSSYNGGEGGGGIKLFGGSLTIYDGAVVSYNKTTTRGGGVDIDKGSSNASFVMTGGEIIHNDSTGWGGGVMMRTVNCSFDFKSGKISYNAVSGTSSGWAPNGGGIFMDGGIFTMSGDAEISYNTANLYNGGIRFVGESCEVHLNGGVIKNNKALGGGAGAVSMGGNPIAFTMSGSISIPFDVEGDSEHKNDIELADGKVIKITGPLSRKDTNPIATIMPISYSRGRTLVEADGINVTDLTPYKDFFAVKNTDWLVNLSADKKKLVLDAPVYVKAGGSSTATGTKTNPFDTIANACSVMNDSSVDYTIYIDGEVKRTGGQTLPDTFTTSNANSITITGANELSAGGIHTDILDANGSDSSLTIFTAVPVKITNLKITGGSSSIGGGIKLSTGELTLGDDVLIEGNSASGYGGIYVDSTASLKVYGNVVVSGNTSDGEISNVFLPAGKTITVVGTLTNSKDSTKKAKIGISTETEPTLDTNVIFTSGYGYGTGGYNKDVKPGNYFFGDKWGVKLGRAGAAGSGTPYEAALAASGGNIIIEPVYEDIEINVDKTSVLKSATEKKFTFSATGTDSEGNTNPITIGSGEGQLALTIYSVTNHGETVPVSYYDTGTDFVTLGNSLPAGNYTINTRAVYQGSLSEARTYSAGFEVKIVDGIQVTASNIDSLTFESGKKYYLAVDSAMTSSDLESLVNKIRESPNINDIGDSTLDLSAMELPDGQLTTQITLNNANITEIIIPDSLTSLWGLIAGQFQNNKKLITVTYNGTNRISWNNCTFQGCTSLKNFPWHALDTFLLGNQVFGGCTSLESVTIPADIEQICPTFDGCSNLKEVHFLGENPPYMQDRAFADCHPDLIFYVPSEAAREAYLNFTGAVSIDSSMKGFANPDVNPYATTPENLAAHVRVEGQ